MSQAQPLQRKLKQQKGTIPEIHAIRLHRSLSWLQAAEEQEKQQDLRFITLWISCNSLYSMDSTAFEALPERERFAAFTDKLIRLDENDRLYHLLWNKFSGPVRLLVENKYVYAPFWDFQRGTKPNWQKGFEQSIADATKALANRNVNYLLRIVLDRLYVLRNQLIHGGATYKSTVNRAQVRDGSNLLISLLPVMIDIMLSHPQEDWGSIYYPPVS